MTEIPPDDDPLAGYTPDWRERLKKDPLLGYTPDWRDRLRQAGQADQRQESVLGRRTVEFETNQRYLDQIEKSLPTAEGERRARLERERDRVKKEMNPFSLADNAGESARRAVGGAIGAIPQMGLGLLQLPTAVAHYAVERPLNALGVPTGQWGRRALEGLQERLAGVDELTGAKGVEGIVGAIGGTFGLGAAEVATSKIPLLSKIPLVGRTIAAANAPARLYGEMSNATLRFLGKSETLRSAARAGMEGTRAQRMMGSVIGDLPANVLQAMALPDANVYDVARGVGLGAAGALVGGALSGRVPFDPTGKYDIPQPPPQQPPSTGMTTGPTPRGWSGGPEAGAGAGPRPTADINDPSLRMKAEILRRYILGEIDNVADANKAYWDLAQAGVTSEQLVQMMGMQAGIVNGNAVMTTPDGRAPSPERLLLASGEAPRETRTAARIASDSRMNRSSRIAKLFADTRNELKAERVERRRLERELERDHMVPELPGFRAWAAAREGIESDPNTYVAYFDLNNFSKINNQLGHDAGDAAIKNVGLVIAATAKHHGIRAFRPNPSGDEFILAGPKDLVALARDEIEAQLYGEDAGGVIYSISGGIGKNMVEAEMDAAPRKIAAKQMLGQPISREDQSPNHSLGTVEVFRIVKDFGLEEIVRAAAKNRTGQPHIEAEVAGRTVVNQVRDMLAAGLDLDRVKSRLAEMYGAESATMPVKQPEMARETPPMGQPDGGDSPATIDPQTVRHGGEPPKNNIDEMRARWNALEDQLESMPAGAERDRIQAEANRLWAEIAADDPSIPPTRESLPRTPEPDPAPTGEALPADASTPRTEHLETVNIKTDPREMTPKQIERLMDRVLGPFDANPELIKTPAYQAAQRDIAKLKAVLEEMNDLPPQSAFALDNKVKRSDLEAWLARPLEGMSEDDLGTLNVMLQSVNTRLKPGHPLKDAVVDKLLELRAYQQKRINNAERKKPKQRMSQEDIYDQLKREGLELKKKKGTEGFTSPELTASVVSFFSGGLIGYSLPADDEQERLRNALIGAGILGSATVGTFYQKGRQKLQNIQRRATIPGQQVANEIMRTKTKDSVFADMTFAGIFRSVVNAMDRLYYKTLHPSTGGERFARLLADGTAKGKEVGDMLATFGMWHRNTQQWIKYGAQMQDAQGNWVPRTTVRGDGTVAPVLPLVKILESVDNDIELLGQTAMYLSSLELYAKNKKMPHPKMNPLDASRFIGQVDPRFVEAAKQMRDVHLGLLDLQVQAGIIDPKQRATMATEMFYTALDRIFGDPLDMASGRNIASKKKGIKSPQTIHSRKGPNDWEIRNPVESLIMNIPRVLKAVELQEKKGALIDLWFASNVPDLVKKSFMRPVTFVQGKDPQAFAWQQKIQQMQAMMPGMSQAQAQQMIAAFDPRPLGPNADYMTYIRNGKVETWKLAPDLVETFAYMQGHEIAQFWKAIGVGSNLVRQGVGLDPSFVARMGWADVFQTYLNSEYVGSLRDFMPGMNWIEGFYNAVKRSDAYKAEFGGGTMEASHLEGLNTPEDVIRRAQSAGDTYTQEIWRNVKGLHLLDAYKTLITPFAEAGRLGELLAARRHGKTVEEALRSATAVAGYYNQVGSYAAGMFRAVPFLKGASQSLDQMLYMSGAHPFRAYDGDRLRKAMIWWAKGMSIIAAPTALFYAANADDEEIQQIRQTEYGRRFWFFRGPKGELYSVRKPFGPEGQLFGTGVEIALDRFRGQEPEAFKRWTQSMLNEFQLPWLPPTVQATGALLTGQDLSFGTPILSSRAEGLPTDQASNTYTSQSAKDMSKVLVSMLGQPKSDFFHRALSPAGIEYIARTLGGTLGGEAFKLADAAQTIATTGTVPTVQELPVIRRFVSLDMTKQQTRDLEDFYNFAEQAERLANGLSQSAKQGDIEGFVSISTKYQNELFAGNMILDARRDVADITRAIQEIRGMDINSEVKRATLIRLRQQLQTRVSLATSVYRQAIQK